MPNPFFSARIPENLNKRVEDFIKETGKAKTEILIEALALYLDCPVEIKKTITNEEIWQAIDELRSKVNVLEESIKRNAIISTDNKLDNNTNLSKSNEIYDQLPLLSENVDREVLKSILPENTKDLILKTNDIPFLPGLEKIDSEKIKTMLRNAKSQNRTPVKIGGYLIDISGKEAGNKGSLLWKVLEKPD
jgi:hypothetical protein